MQSTSTGAVRRLTWAEIVRWEGNESGAQASTSAILKDDNITADKRSADNDMDGSEIVARVNLTSNTLPSRHAVISLNERPSKSGVNTPSYSTLLLMTEINQANKDAQTFNVGDKLSFELIQAPTDVSARETESFHFVGEEGFDFVKIESKSFRFEDRQNEIVIFEIKKSSMHMINFKKEQAPDIYRFITQITISDNFRERRRFGSITVSSNFNNSGRYLKIAKEKGSFILIPVGPKNSYIKKFMAIFSNFVGLTTLV
ncbi:unnamed protein product [Cuscuta europaea]|uniref:Uncharacterized protein n=1 Tax=Cuscuta europaea TaxID=41803 RepID=A0A9P1EH09_CUSEU|nr:unnamed protein product [Cuscuta europaea]